MSHKIQLKKEVLKYTKVEYYNYSKLLCNNGLSSFALN